MRKAQYHVFDFSKIAQSKNTGQRALEDFIKSLKLKIVQFHWETELSGGYYDEEDRIYMRVKDYYAAQTDKEYQYYPVLLHEVGHWTGGSGRIKRKCAISYFLKKKLASHEEDIARFFVRIVLYHFDILSYRRWAKIKQKYYSEKRKESIESAWQDAIKAFKYALKTSKKANN